MKEKKINNNDLKVYNDKLKHYINVDLIKEKLAHIYQYRGAKNSINYHNSKPCFENASIMILKIVSNRPSCFRYITIIDYKYYYISEDLAMAYDYINKLIHNPLNESDSISGWSKLMAKLDYGYNDYMAIIINLNKVFDEYLITRDNTCYKWDNPYGLKLAKCIEIDAKALVMGA